MKTMAPKGIPSETNDNALPLFTTNHFKIGTEVNIFPGLLKFINPITTKKMII